MIKRLVLALLALTGIAHAAPDDELLPAEKAFELTATTDAQTIELRWKIAPGYYLYRDKFKLKALDRGLHLQEPQFPTAQIKEDPFFGRTAIYTEHAVIRVPFQAAETATRARLQVTAQGCNEPIGVCYPPTTTELSLALPASSNSGAALPPNTGVLGNFSRSLGIGTPQAEVVDPEKAFRIDASVVDGSSIHVRFAIDGCCYVYRDKLRFSIDATEPREGLRLGAPALPAGEVLTDEFFGRTEVYRGNLELRLPLIGVNTAATDFVLTVGYQGCSEKGVKICYPPTTRQIPISFGASSASATGTGGGFDGLLWAMLGAFAGGLLLTFTPCVLPMIPILSGVIVGAEGARLTKLRGGLLSYTYVLGTALTYTIAGAIAGATGEQLQAYFQNPWAIGLFSAMLVALALSMFGLYELHLPASLQTLLHRHSAALHHRSKGHAVGEFIGVFLLGAVSALIIGACVAPILAATVATAIATRDAWLGGAIMFALAHGQGAILVAIGVSGGLLLPKAGAWMKTVKHLFGVLLVAVAIYLLGALPEVPVLFLWSVLFIVSAVYLGATQSLPKGATGWEFLRKGVGTFLLIWGVVVLIGGFAGSRDLFDPLPLERLVQGGRAPVPADSVFKPVRSMPELDTALAEARAAGKPVILDYYATWCQDCVRMEHSTFLDPTVRATLASRFVALQADVTAADDPAVRALKRRFDVYGPPAMLFFDAHGQEQRRMRIYGFQSPDELLATLARL